ncbi:molybdopterin oxidoreductase family protein [Corallococcus sp. H22C18031201]|nr:molybdopterin oxidoreductase family protein [Corallococcus sp. H22C18031201]
MRVSALEIRGEPCQCTAGQAFVRNRAVLLGWVVSRVRGWTWLGLTCYPCRSSVFRDVCAGRRSDVARTHFRTCPLCEAMCGIALKCEEGLITDIRGDPDDPLSRGYLCPKAVALKDIHEDPLRLRQPLRRVGSRWEPVGWDEALDEVAERLHAVRREHGADSVAYYQGNPHVHNHGALLMAMEFTRSLGSRSRFSTASMDHLPHLLTAYQMFGHQLLMPVPDLDRTDLLVVLGGNPAVSNGSLMTAPDMTRRLKALRQRGGRVVVIDPRRTRTAELGDTHHFIRPGTDPLLLLALIQTLFHEGKVALGRLADFTDGVEVLREVSASYNPERVAAQVGISAEDIRALALDLAAAPTAVVYGRLGVCTQEFGTLNCWLINAINVLTGNLDRPGGAAFTRPAVDTVAVGKWMGQQGELGGWSSRVRGLPAFTGELPVATLAEELDTPGEGRLRALVCAAGNPVLTAPNGGRLARALDGLDFMVAIDFYVNETARHAHFVLPPTFALERDHYDVAMHMMSVRNTTRYCPPMVPAGPEARHDWEIYLDLAIRLDALRDGPIGWLGVLRGRLLRWLTPTRLIDLFLRIGPYGRRSPLGRGLSLAALREQAHAVDLGPLEPCLPRRLYTRGKRLQLAPPLLVADLKRLSERFTAQGATAAAPELVLIGRRQLRTNNSWMHHVPRLTKGPDTCTLLMHPEDARRLSLREGQAVAVCSRVGRVTAPLEITDAIMPGVVSLPHGFGQHAGDAAPGMPAVTHPGVSLNDLTDDARVDALSGTIAFSGVPVTVVAAEAEVSATG